MAYFPKSQFKIKFTPGKQFRIATTKEEYKGFYMKTSRKSFYTGTQPSPESKELERISFGELVSQATTALANAALARVQAALQELTTKALSLALGAILRFFIKNKKTRKIKEITRDQVNIFKNDPRYEVAEIEWTIVGPVEDQIINGFKFEGAATKNRKAVEKAETTFPGIKDYLTNYSELVVDNVRLRKQELEQGNVKYYLYDQETGESIELES